MGAKPAMVGGSHTRSDWALRRGLLLQKAVPVKGGTGLQPVWGDLDLRVPDLGQIEHKTGQLRIAVDRTDVLQLHHSSIRTINKYSATVRIDQPPERRSTSNVLLHFVLELGNRVSR